jgi:hypothetical protein
MNNKNVVRASQTYKSVPVQMASAFMGWNISCMTGNTAFPKPPVPIVPPVPPDPTVPVDMTTRKASLDAAISAALDGGTVLTSARNAALQFALDGLDANAFYCQTTARYDLPMFLTSGYQAASNNHGQSQLDTPSVTGIDNDISMQLAVHLSPHSQRGWLRGADVHRHGRMDDGQVLDAGAHHHPDGSNDRHGGAIACPGAGRQHRSKRLVHARLQHRGLKVGTPR